MENHGFQIIKNSLIINLQTPIGGKKKEIVMLRQRHTYSIIEKLL